MKSPEDYLRQQIDIAIAEVPCGKAFDGIHIWTAMPFKRYWRKDIYRRRLHEPRQPRLERIQGRAD